MEVIVISVPAMYGDHHVVEVRRLLLQLAGVESVNASSCFRTVEVSYDPAKTTADQIGAKLGKAGYLGELSVPVESGTAVSQEATAKQEIVFRHTMAYEQTNQIVSFAQNVADGGRPLWPCPGVGVLQGTLQEETTHG